MTTTKGTVQKRIGLAGGLTGVTLQTRMAFTTLAPTQLTPTMGLSGTPGMDGGIL